ncbi:MAG TPA: YdeI/OmpD-associated family protein [Candidatus Acidoferrum sp.]|nr:YdeI/OmpD-associated family protein [Candidatus Acidoferrum sp.]
MPVKTFKAVLEDGFVGLPFDVKKEFGKARPPVKISINGFSYRSTVSVYGGKYMVPVRKSRQEAAGAKEGDVVKVTIALDAEERTVDPPPDLKAALAKNAAAKARWDKLSFTHKREHAEALLDAKKPETRARRLQRTLAMLAAKPR